VYTVRVERLGYETRTSDPIRLHVGQSFRIRMLTFQIPIELDELRVEGEQQCVVRPEEGMALATVWEEARKALTIQEWTESEGFYRFQLLSYERELDVAARQVESESRQLSRGVARSPIHSLPAAELMEDGFVQREEDGGFSYYGPDATVLLSDEFLDTHCFRLTRDRDRPTLLGLAFEPARRGRIPDIEGTLWLDAGTAELRLLEYSYTWEPWVEARGAARGRVEFERLSSGAWIVRRWSIRMPRMARDYSMSGVGVRLAGILEQGGEILRATSLGGNEVVALSEAPPGVLAGRVWDSLARRPLPNANVYLRATPFSVATDSAGRFSLTGVPEGVYTAGFSHPRLDSLQLTLPGVEVEVERGSVTSVELGIPFAENLVELLCPGDFFPDSTSVLMGSVLTDEERTPVEGARVLIRWEVSQRLTLRYVTRTPWSVEAHTDSGGRFVACGIPVGYPLTVQAFHGDQLSEPRELFVGGVDGTWVELVVGPGSWSLR
jgi:hypothetical protein